MNEVRIQSHRGRSKEHWFVLFCAILIPVGMATMALLLEPDDRGFGTHEQLGIRPCQTMELWGFPCPGCGVTTSVTLASQGRLLASLAAQPFGLFLAVAGVLFSLWSFWGQLRGRDLYVAFMILPHTRIGFVVLGVALVSWLYKWFTI